MNAIFAVVFLISCALFLFTEPDGFLATLLSGGQKVLEQSGLSQKLTRWSMPVTKRLFRSDDQTALFLAGGNLSANLLGLPGAPTPLGVKATKRFIESGNSYAADMLFVLNATSLQILPTTVIALRLAAGSAFPADIFLPTLLATLVSSAVGGTLVFLTRKRKKK